MYCSWSICIRKGGNWSCSHTRFDWIYCQPFTAVSLLGGKTAKNELLLNLEDSLLVLVTFLFGYWTIRLSADQIFFVLTSFEIIFSKMVLRGSLSSQPANSRNYHFVVFSSYDRQKKLHEHHVGVKWWNENFPFSLLHVLTKKTPHFSYEKTRATLLRHVVDLCEYNLKRTLLVLRTWVIRCFSYHSWK